MSSRRKASTPCMIRQDQTMVELDDEAEEPQDMETTAEDHAEEGPMETDLEAKTEPSLELAPDKPENETPDLSKPQRKHQGGYECKYCPFSTQNLNTFKEHVDANHPNVILNPLYLCAVCNFNTKKFDTLTEHNERCHPGESNFKFKRIKMNNQTILEQSIEGCSSSAVIFNTSSFVSGRAEERGSLPIGKPAVVRTVKPRIVTSDARRTDSQLGKQNQDLGKKPITALSVNGTVIIPESTLLKADGLSHIMPSLQRPLNYTQVPKIAVPLNTTKYNPSLDDNLTLISSFTKFPYPTQAELSWLTAASKHPEEQIKIWFTTQRLKQGISWSPEEVEEARKKMFNGTISPAPQTFTLVTPHLTSQSSAHLLAPPTASKHLPSAASVLQSLPQLLGQTSLVLTPVANGSTFTCAPLALAMANQVAQSLKRPLTSPVIASESKRSSIIQNILAPMATSKQVPAKMFSFTVDPNKTGEQLSVLRSSYTQCPFPEEDEVYRLIETTGLSRGEIKKWFSEQRLLNLKGVPAPPVLVKAEAAPPPPPPRNAPVKKAVPSQFPLLERVKGKSSEQLKALEGSFQRSSSPTEADIDQLAQEARLSKTEVDCWFSERRALRDNMEKALLTMASKNAEDRGERLLNGTHREQDRKSLRSPSHPAALSSSSSSPPVLAASSPDPPTLSSSASPPILTSSSSSSSSSSPNPPILSASMSPAPISGSSLALLREMFCRTQWPSPEEYSQLEVQTSQGRTDIVRWFKDHRSALKNGETLDWMEEIQTQKLVEPPEAEQELNGQTCEKKRRVSSEVQADASSPAEEEECGKKEPAVMENCNQSNEDKEQPLTDRLSDSVTGRTEPEPGRTEPDPDRSGTAVTERRVKVSAAAGEESEDAEDSQRAETEADALSPERPGRVTG